MTKPNMRLYYPTGSYRDLIIDTTRYQLFDLVVYRHTLVQKNLLRDIPFVVCDLFFANETVEIVAIKNNRLLKATVEERV
jgi:hypothetical protein